MKGLLKEEAERLKRFYAVTDDILFLRAACVLLDEQMPIGNTPKTDGAHLIRMAWLIHKGLVKGPWPAAQLVAAKIGGYATEDSIARRLYGKFNRNKEKYNDSLTLALFEVPQNVCTA